MAKKNNSVGVPEESLVEKVSPKLEVISSEKKVESPEENSFIVPVDLREREFDYSIDNLLEPIISSKLGKGLDFSSSYKSKDESGNDANIHIRQVRDIYIENIIFQYTNCYEDSFDFQIVKSKTEFEASSEITNIGIDADSGKIIPIQGGRVKLTNINPVVNNNGEGKWVFVDQRFQAKLQQHEYIPRVQTYDLFAFHSPVKTIMVDFMVDGTGSIPMPVNTVMKRGYSLVFENYYTEECPFGTKISRIGFKYRNYKM
jgi:hypothetical protein